MDCFASLAITVALFENRIKIHVETSAVRDPDAETSVILAN
jgi:hypothetical protein